MRQMAIKIKTVSPVILSTRGNTDVMTATYDYFSGNVLRGILAGRYIQKAGLGKKAHENADFVELFFQKLRFVDAYPVNQTTGCRSMVMPLSLQKIKDGNSIIDLLQQDSEANYKPLRGFGSIEQGKIYSTEIQKNITLHMSRSDSGSQDGKERLAGRSIKGGIYNYESIAPGQSFEGYIFGNQEALEKLMKVLQENVWLAHVGRSQYTQYGSCSIELGEIEDLPVAQKAEGRSVCLRLETPLLLAGLSNDAQEGLNEFARAMNECCQREAFHIQSGKRKIFSKAEKVDSFVGVWGMKCPRLNALAAGTIFIIQKEDDWNDEDWKHLIRLCYEGIGLRTEEGYGQVRVWQCPKLKYAKTPDKVRPARQAVKSSQVSKYAQEIVKKKMREAVRLFAAEDVEQARKYFPQDANHLFARLDSMLDEKSAYCRSNMQNSLEAEKGGESTPLTRMLRKVEVSGTSLGELLENAPLAQMPYNNQKHDWQSVLSPKIHEVLADIDDKLSLEELKTNDKLFYEYWHWFFRNGRKAEKLERWWDDE
ncbi:CRISPR-associated protein Csx10 [Selenomonas ruminantium]|uniref:CRISPR-associated protein Csx10 n=2 Tax=Selenomonas ruminantium TaxID=971 RepID=A0A1H0NKJ9_SELRU|nr:CRISPR-associated protein Csx10 [Selenomonas ruminantium]